MGRGSDTGGGGGGRGGGDGVGGVCVEVGELGKVARVARLPVTRHDAIVAVAGGSQLPCIECLGNLQLTALCADKEDMASHSSRDSFLRTSTCIDNRITYQRKTIIRNQ